MIEVKVMIVPGKIARVSLESGGTVIDAAKKAQRENPDIEWIELVKTREVRVQNRKFSNTDEIPEGYSGSIFLTPLDDNDVVLVLTKIKGNVKKVGSAVLTCEINGTEYALETPDTVKNVLQDVAGFRLDKVEKVFINSEESPLDQMVGNDDKIQVETTESDEVVVAYRGRHVSGSPEEIISRLFD